MARPKRFMSSDRLQAYSDAVYAIVITIMVIPLTQEVEKLDPDMDLLETLKDIYVKIVIYILSFLIIYTFWEGHVWIFQCIEYVGDMVVLINLILLLIVTFIPYSVTLLTEHMKDKFAVLLFCGTLLTITVIEIFIVLLALCKPKMVKEELIDSGQFPFLRGSIIIALVFKMMLIVMAGGFSFVHIYASWVFLILLIFSNTLSAFVCAGYKQLQANKDDHHGNCCKYMCHRLIGEKLHKGRIEAFSDGVYSIVATLIILDICTGMFPSAEERSSVSPLSTVILHQTSLLLVYAATFMTVGMLWFIHHSIFQYIFRVHRLMSFFNKLSLLFIGLMPFGFRLVNLYALDSASNSTELPLSLQSLLPDKKSDRKEYYIIQLNCGVIFCASMCQLFMWLSGHWKRKKHLYLHHKGINYGITLCKLLVYPVVSATVFCLAFSSFKVTAELLAVVQLCVLIVHFIIKMFYEIIFKTCGKKSAEETGESDGQLMVLDSLPRSSKNRHTESLRAGVFLNHDTDDTYL
ncbi:endosomal/lysosomal proton channel TMEM175-like [Glandiceps talaboti]